MAIVHYAGVQLESVPAQMSGEVVNCLPDGTYTVQAHGRGWHTQRAASCLLQPALHDTVLLASDGEKIWLLAVLERARPMDVAQLKVTGDLCISSEQGTLSLSSDQQVAIDSNTFQLDAEEGKCNVTSMHYCGQELSAWVGVSRWMGETCESLWRTVTQISQSLFRQVKNVEHVRAGQIDYQAEDFVRMHARNTLITSKDITKLDSEQIHLG